MQSKKKPGYIYRVLGGIVLGFSVGGLMGTTVGLVQNCFLRKVPLKARVLFVGKQTMMSAFSGAFFIGILAIIKV